MNIQWACNFFLNFALKVLAVWKKFQKTSGGKIFWLTLYIQSLRIGSKTHHNKGDNNLTS